jgi:hypothetical protein
MVDISNISLCSRNNTATDEHELNFVSGDEGNNEYEAVNYDEPHSDINNDHSGNDNNDEDEDTNDDNNDIVENNDDDNNHDENNDDDNNHDENNDDAARAQPQTQGKKRKR